MAQRHDLGAVSLPAVPRERAVAGGAHGRACYRQQVRAALARQASLQPDELRTDDDDARDRWSCVGIARTVGQRCVFRVSHGLSWRIGRDAREAGGRGARISRMLVWAADREVPLSWGATDDPD